MVYHIKISKPLRKYVNNLSTVSIDGDSYFNLYSNMVNLFPDLRNCGFELSTNTTADLWFLSNGKLLSHAELFFSPSKKDELVLVPVIHGAGDGGVELFVGLALIAISLIAMQPQFAFGIAAQMSGAAGLTAVFGTAGVITTIAEVGLSIGIGLALAGAVSLFSSKGGSVAAPQAQNDSSVRAENDAFGPLQNTTSTQTAIPLIFGQIRVPGQFIGGRIRTISHDASTVISVANYI